MSHNNKVLLVFFSIFFSIGSFFVIADLSSRVGKMKIELKQKEIEIKKLEKEILDREQRILNLIENADQ